MSTDLQPLRSSPRVLTATEFVRLADVPPEA